MSEKIDKIPLLLIQNIVKAKRNSVGIRQIGTNPMKHFWTEQNQFTYFWCYYMVAK